MSKQIQWQPTKEKAIEHLLKLELKKQRVLKKQI